MKISVFLAITSLFVHCFSQYLPNKVRPIAPSVSTNTAPIQTGAERLELYLPQLKGKKIALVVNHTAVVGSRHLLDTLLASGVNVRKIFAPEHGFRGIAAAGEILLDGTDSQTGLPICSLYGKKKQPSAADLAGIDLVVFDIQDVGARFYTYISTLYLVMESCGKMGLPIMVLDRPNPNGHYVDGPVLEPALQSFVGMLPIPIVHGCTVGELAKMINGEGRLSPIPPLTVIPCTGYTHDSEYSLPIKPSPNLPNMLSVYLYPTLCLFEGTIASVGRGTDFPFQQVGYPGYSDCTNSFIPRPNAGAPKPFLEGLRCCGLDLSGMPLDSARQMRRIHLEYLEKLYKTDFFLQNGFFDQLAGNRTLRRQLESGMPCDSIRESWKEELNAYRLVRKKYLLYTDFK